VNSYKLLEDVAEDNFTQLYDDLIDAHGYLIDNDNKRLYKKLGYDLDFIINQFKKTYNHYQNWKPFGEILKESMKKQLIGDCTEIGDNYDLPWEDATSFAQDLGYYAIFEGDPEDSNFEEITKEEFNDACNNILDGDNFIYLKEKSNTIFIAYSEDEDIHFIFG